MLYCPLVKLKSEAEYEQHFYGKYCKGPVITFDGISVRFRKLDFKHCFYESSRRDRIKDRFSIDRAERIDWIKKTLEDPEAILKTGWNRDSKRYDYKKRVAVVSGDYVVVIGIISSKKARFITAYAAGKNTIDKILKGPDWK